MANAVSASNWAVLHPVHPTWLAMSAIQPATCCCPPPSGLLPAQRRPPNWLRSSAGNCIPMLPRSRLPHAVRLLPIASSGSTQQHAQLVCRHAHSATTRPRQREQQHSSSYSSIAKSALPTTLPPRTLPLYASFSASRVFWLTTVSTRAMPLRTTLLRRDGRGGHARRSEANSGMHQLPHQQAGGRTCPICCWQTAAETQQAWLAHAQHCCSCGCCNATACPPTPTPAHILDSLLGAPPVTLATRRPLSSCFSSLSCTDG